LELGAVIRLDHLDPERKLLEDVGGRGEEFGGQLRVLDGELVDGPGAHKRLAELCHDARGIGVAHAELPHQRGPPRHKVLERPTVEAGDVHGCQV
jgi:hypothetical protein